ncbi:hypothetical protein CQW23_00752 [Capsicum baccatum]|uniref:PPIase cyclophilin-type domain-containing protein n=1 Tax=Capsicum baccatum TaxID=33114 RepID=A0A2G2XLP9_CAPBA|nr:hypothetical protein CQW23_00752 [Capsicum baccatum]
MTNVPINIGKIIRSTMRKSRLHKRSHFTFGNLLTAILRKEDIEEEPTDHKLPHNPKKVDLTKVKDAETTHGVNLTTAERHARDESFFRHLYGMTRFTMMSGELQQLNYDYPMNENVRAMCGVGVYFEEPLKDDVPTDDDSRMPDSDVEENSDGDDSDDDSDEGVIRPAENSAVDRTLTVEDGGGGTGGGEECCSGVESFELWGDAVKWGSDFKVNSSKECCKACKDMCTGNHGPCLCDTWVFCGDKNACGDKFGECWLKKQKDTLAPDKKDAGNKIMWTSGIVFGKGEEIFYSAFVMFHLFERSFNFPEFFAFALPQFQASFGPPYALLQGTLGAQGTALDEVSREFCPEIRRGSVAWVGSGPEFFISLANHQEWKKTYTVFGYVLPEDMQIVEKIAQLPTKFDVWTGVNVTVLENPVPLKLRRIKSSNVI